MRDLNWARQKKSIKSIKYSSTSIIQLPFKSNTAEPPLCSPQLSQLNTNRTAIIQSLIN